MTAKPVCGGVTVEGRTRRMLIKEADVEALAGAEDERNQDAGRKKERTEQPGAGAGDDGRGGGAGLVAVKAS
jgi:hypothetical protein